MKKLIVLALLSTSLTGCALFNGLKTSMCPTPLRCATNILHDFKWGVDEAGAQLWLSADDVAIADDLIAVGLDTVAATPGGNWKTVVAATLDSIKTHISQADRWAPYINAALLALSLA